MLYHVQIVHEDKSFSQIARRFKHRLDALDCCVGLQPDEGVCEAWVIAVPAEGKAKITHRFGRWAEQPGELVVRQ